MPQQLLLLMHYHWQLNSCIDRVTKHSLLSYSEPSQRQQLILMIPELCGHM